MDKVDIVGRLRFEAIRLLAIGVVIGMLVMFIPMFLWGFNASSTALDLAPGTGSHTDTAVLPCQRDTQKRATYYLQWPTAYPLSLLERYCRTHSDVMLIEEVGTPKEGYTQVTLLYYMLSDRHWCWRGNVTALFTAGSAADRVPVALLGLIET